MADARTNPPGKSIAWWLSRLLIPGSVLLTGILLIFLLGLAQRIGWIRTSSGTDGSAATSEAAAVHTCPMHPQIRQPGPGRCPICGMALVAAAAGGQDGDELSVTITPAQRRLSNIETAPVREAPLVDSVRTVGAIAIDESRMATIASWFDGRIERVFADYTGVKVAKNDHLAVVYSPELYAAQVDYLESRRSLATASTLEAVRRSTEKLVEKSREKLVELGMRDQQISDLEASEKARSRQTIYSTVSGTVVEKLAVEGKYVKAGEPLYRVANLSMVWLMLELYPEDAARIRFGQRVDARVSSLPGRTFEGRVAFIDPTVDSVKRTVGVRVEYRNEDELLRPGDYADASIQIAIGETGEVYDADLAGKWISPMHPQIIADEPGQCPVCGMDLVPTSRYGYATEPIERTTALYVPRSAVLMAGDSSVVYVEEEPGRFEVRVIRPGPILRDKVVVLDGLKEGEQVATAGNFLIDSQMQLAGKPSLIDPTRAIAAQAERKEPLNFRRINIQRVAGEPGRLLELLYKSYFEVHAKLASDELPTAENAEQLHQTASQLAEDATFSAAAQKQLAAIAEHSGHLHHQSLNDARHKSFRPVSHAVVTLATLVRGQDAATDYKHMFCPMVKGGAGDWLQAGGDLLNPYYGSEMLSCGEVVRTLSPQAASAESSDEADRERSDAAETPK